jgi:hypothetical protein
MSRSRSNCVPPHDGHARPAGRNSSSGRSYQASAPYSSKTDAARWNRHAPRALPRDAPVRPVRQHVEQPIAAPRGDPRHIAVDRVQPRLPQGLPRRVSTADHRIAVEPDEPLGRREKNHRVVAPPAVRILMREIGAMPQLAALGERRLDVRVGIEHALAGEHVHRLEEAAARAHRRVDLEPVAHAGREVVGAVSRRGVHRTGSGVERDVIGEHAERRPCVERVLEPDVLERRSLEARDRCVERTAGGLGHLRRQRFRHDHDAAACLVRGVVEVRVERDRQVRRNRPRRRGPDQHRHVPPLELREPRRELVRALRRQRELHINRRRGVLLVFDFRLGKRGPAVDAPMDGLLALVDEALVDEFPQGARDRGLIAEVHRQVGMFPVAEDRQTLELGRHDADEPLGVGAAGAAEIGHGHVALLRPKLAVDLQLDRQAVAVVARHIRRVEAGHRSRLDDEVLENLVQRGAEVDLPVRVRRTVVEHQLRRPGARRTNLPVEVHRRPPRQRLGLAGREVRLHRKPRAGQVQRVFPVRHAIRQLYKRKAGRP